MQARSRSELADRLARKGIPPESAERVLGRLAAAGLVDDAAYAEAFVASKRRDRGLGRAGLRRELIRKGVDREIVDGALAGLDDDDERRAAADLVARKMDSAMFAGPVAARRRLLSMLARRGYSASVAGAVVAEALRGFVADDDGAGIGDDDEPSWPGGSA